MGGKAKYREDIRIVEEDAPNLFEQFTTADFEAWLRVGLEEYFLEDRDIWGFRGAEGILSGHEHLVKKLGKFFSEMNSRQRQHFREACSDILAILPCEERYIPVFEYLLSIAVEVRAHEILRVLPSRIANDFFGLTSERDGESLFAQILLTVAQLAAPRADTLRCLRALIGSTHFDHAYASVALLALCNCSPENISEHIDLLRYSLANMFKEFDTDKDVKRELAESILEIIGLNRLVEAFPHLMYFNRQSENAPLDFWFLEALLVGDHAPLICQETENDWFQFCTSDSEAIQELLPKEGMGLSYIIAWVRAANVIKQDATSEQLVRKNYCNIVHNGQCPSVCQALRMVHGCNEIEAMN